MKCTSCGAEMESAKCCPSCGKTVNQNVNNKISINDTKAIPSALNENNSPNQNRPNKKPVSRKTAAILAILLGTFGIHKFYLGRIIQGIIYLLLCMTGISTCLGIVEGIIYFAVGEERFNDKYNNPSYVRPKWQKICMGVAVGGAIFIFACSCIAVYNDGRVDRLIDEGKYAEAKAILDKGDNTTYTSHKRYAKLYAAQNLYDEATMEIYNYCKYKDISEITEDTMQIMESYSKYASDDIKDMVNEYSEKYISYNQKIEDSETIDKNVVSNNKTEIQETKKEEIQKINNDVPATKNMENNIEDSNSKIDEKINNDEKEDSYTEENKDALNTTISKEEFIPNHVYVVEEFPFGFTEGKKYSKLCAEAMRNLDKCVRIEIEQHLMENDSYKMTINASNDTNHFYFGDIVDGRPNGDGVVILEWDYSTVVYAGHYKDGRLDGYGIKLTLVDQKTGYYAAHIEYEGYYEDGQYSGSGICYDPANKDVTGDVVNWDGQNMNVATSRIKYKGDFKQGKYDGKGILYGVNPETMKRYIYEGEFIAGEFGGKGILYNEDKSKIYEGEFKQGKYDGKGTLYNLDGSVMYSGDFKKGDIS